MLRACRRVLRPGGRVAFLTIIPAPDLTSSQRRHAVRAGPPALLPRHDHQSILGTAGFRDIEETDVTADYLTTVRAWLEQSAAREAELRPVLGDALFEDRQHDRRLQASAIEAGLLRRSLFVGHAGQADGLVHAGGAGSTRVARQTMRW